MKKQDLIMVYSEIEPDELMKQRIEKKVFDMKREEPKYKNTFLKKTALIGICAALILGTAAAFPVMAEYIPVVRRALSFFTSDDAYFKDPVMKNDAVPELAESINSSAADSKCGISFSVQDVYNDGNDVLIYYIFETSDAKYDAYNGISAENFSLFADGKEIVFSEEDFYQSPRVLSSGRYDDNLFAGMMMLKSKFLPDADKVNMTIKITNLKMTNSDVYYFNFDAEDPRYDYAPPELYEADLSCSFDIIRRNDLIKTYNIGQEKDGILLKSVTISPVRTHIEIENCDDYVWELKDNNGNEIEFLGMYDFDTPLKNAKSLTLSISRLDKDNTVNPLKEICSFTFDIDGGFRNIDTFKTQKYDNRKITFIPTEEEADKWIEEHRKK